MGMAVEPRRERQTTPAKSCPGRLRPSKRRLPRGGHPGPVPRTPVTSQGTTETQDGIPSCPSCACVVPRDARPRPVPNPSKSALQVPGSYGGHQGFAAGADHLLPMRPPPGIPHLLLKQRREHQQGMRLQPGQGSGFIGRAADGCSKHRGRDPGQGALENAILEPFQFIFFGPRKWCGRFDCRQIPPGDTGGGFKYCFHDDQLTSDRVDVVWPECPGPASRNPTNRPRKKEKPTIAGQSWVSGNVMENLLLRSSHTARGPGFPPGTGRRDEPGDALLAAHPGHNHRMTNGVHFDRRVFIRIPSRVSNPGFDSAKIQPSWRRWESRGILHRALVAGGSAFGVAWGRSEDTAGTGGIPHYKRNSGRLGLVVGPASSLGWRVVRLP